MKKKPEKVTVSISDLQLDAEAAILDQSTVSFSTKNNNQVVVAKADLKFSISDDGVIATCINVSYDARYMIEYTLGDLLLRIKHWCQSQGINQLQATCSPDEISFYRNYGFDIPDEVTVTSTLAAE